MRRQNHPSGFTLIEVMTAIVVFSIGLIGLGFLMTSAVRSNQVGFQHTQAVFAAETLLDRMRANLRGVNDGRYTGTVSGATATPGNLCGATSPCSPQDVATRDLWQWGRLIGQTLPNASGTVACVRPAGAFGVPVGTDQSIPTYDGHCTITIAWTEKTESNNAAGVAAQFQWVVRP